MQICSPLYLRDERVPLISYEHLRSCYVLVPRICPLNCRYEAFLLTIVDILMT